MAQRDRLICRYGPEKVKKCQTAWEFLMEAMQGQPVEERMHAAGSVAGEWKAIMDHLQKDYKNIAMQGDKDPRLSSPVSKGSSQRIDFLSLIHI